MGFGKTRISYPTNGQVTEGLWRTVEYKVLEWFAQLIFLQGQVGLSAWYQNNRLFSRAP